MTAHPLDNPVTPGGTDTKENPMTDMQPNTWHTLPDPDSDGYMPTSTVARILRGLPCQNCEERGDQMALLVRDNGETWLECAECREASTALVRAAQTTPSCEGCGAKGPTRNGGFCEDCHEAALKTF
jgi:hypothetical protein